MDVTAVCPHCGKAFPHNKINGLHLLEIIGQIEARNRMYCKLALDDLERLSRENGNLSFSSSKKIVLDNFNDYTRSIMTILGWGTEAE